MPIPITRRWTWWHPLAETEREQKFVQECLDDRVRFLEAMDDDF